MCNLFLLVNSDLDAYRENGKIAWTEPSIFLVIMFRLMSCLKKIKISFIRLSLTILFMPIYIFLSILLGINIPRSTIVGKGLRIHHFGCIIINSYCVIGNYCIIRHGVTIGNKNQNDDCPVIGNNCDIGAGAKILGKIKIGNNVTIGANAVVLIDLPDNCIAVGVPAKVIKFKIIDTTSASI